MPPSIPKQTSGRASEELLGWAIAVSLAVHLLLYGGYRAGNRFHWWDKSLFPSWLTPTKQLLAQIKKQVEEAKLKPPPEETSLNFLEVDPNVATPEPPKNAKYYSSKNSQAANKDESKVETDNPKLNGAQTHVARTETAPRVKAVPLQPSAPKDPQSQTEVAEAKAKPKGGLAPGELALAKTAPTPGDGMATSDPGDAAQPVHRRPRTLVEAKMSQSLAGDKMKQEGGVHRRLVFDSMDAKATPFGEYDRQLIEAIQNQWYALLDSKSFSRDRIGRVIVQFRLNKDGRVSDMKVLNSDVGDVLTYVCQSAISEPAPYAPWPSDMRRMIDADYREVRFTFYYE